MMIVIMALVTHIENGFLSHCFWADSRCWPDYNYFGGVFILRDIFGCDKKYSAL